MPRRTLAALEASDDIALIRALEDRYCTAFNAKDLDGIMSVYVPGDHLHAFDVVPPRQYVGAEACREVWAGLFAFIKGAPTFEISDLHVVADHTLGYSHKVQRVIGVDINDHPIDITVRVTEVYLKRGGEWKILHEHVSVPVDLETGKPDLASKL
jgi:ketosteroid isomerase-like protein